jgi:hypothetical protein
MRHSSVRRVLSALAVVTALVFGSTTLYSAVMADAPDTLKIDKFAKKKKAVSLPHKQHVDAGIACKTCHHDEKPGVAVKKCVECHTMPATGDAPDAKKAFHDNCIDCHKKEGKAGKKTGPTKCDDCHKG